MKNHNRRRIIIISSSEWHHQVLDILNHSTNNDMIFSQHCVLHINKCNIFKYNLIGGSLTNVYPFTVDILDVCVISCIKFSNVELVLGLLVIVEAIIVARVLRVGENTVGVFFVSGEHVTDVLVCIIFGVSWLRKFIVTGVHEDLSIIFSIHNDLKCKKKQTWLIINRISNITEHSPFVTLGNFYLIDFILFSSPILIEPLIVRIIFIIFNFFIWVFTTFDKISNKRHKSRT